MIIENFQYVTIIYEPRVESVKLMLQEHFNNPYYNNTAIIVNGFQALIQDSFNCDMVKSYKSRIYYMLEHKVTDGTYTDKQRDFDIEVIDGLVNKLGITEFWTMDYEPQLAPIVRDMFNIPVYYVPLRYTSYIQPVADIYTTRKTCDLCLVGTIANGADHRLEIIGEIERKYIMPTKIITCAKNMSSLANELNTSKYILDTLRTGNMATPNQVRIFELLCMGYTVCVEKCGFNMFPGLVYEWETVDELYEIVQRGEYLNPTEAYKKMTYRFEDYEKYANNLIQLQL